MIQSTIQETISSFLGVMQESVQSLAERSASEEARLDQVEGVLQSQIALQEIDLRQTRRLDAMQGELVALQKHLASPKASPQQSVAASPTGGPAFGTNILHAVWSIGWIKSTTFHIRVLLFASNGECAQVSDVLSQLPYCFESL